MHPITASSAAASPDAIVAIGGQDLLHGVPPACAGAGSLAFAGSGVSGAPVARPGGGTGPLRNGNPRGNPNLAPLPGQATHRDKRPTGTSRPPGQDLMSVSCPEGVTRLAMCR